MSERGAKIISHKNGKISAFSWYAGYPYGYRERTHFPFSDFQSALQWAHTEASSVTVIDQKILEQVEAKERDAEAEKVKRQELKDLKRLKKKYESVENV